MNANYQLNASFTGFTFGEIDRVAIPYSREAQIKFFATNLRPDREAKFYFDTVPVDQFVQNASEIVINGTDVSKYNVGEAIICETTNSYAVVIQTASPNKIFLDDNYITISVAQLGAVSLTSSSFTTDTYIWQSNVLRYSYSPVFNFWVGTDLFFPFSYVSFVAQVKYWFFSTRALAVKPIYGNANTTDVFQKRIYRQNPIDFAIANASSITVQNKFPVGATIKSAETPTKTSVVSSYSHKNGVISTVNPTTTKINLSSTYTGTTPTPIKITYGGGVTQSSTISSLESGNTVAVLTTSITGLSANSRYSIGPHVVDSNTNLAGIFNLPETDETRFLAGQRLFTITDSSTYNATDGTMRAATVYNSGERGTTNSFRGERIGNSGDTGSTITGGNVTGQPGANTADGSINDEVDDRRTTDEGTGRGTPTTIIDNRFTSRIPGFNYNLGTLGVTYGDPVAQTFFTPRTEYGVFVSSIDLFFKSKPGSDDAQLPVTVKIVTTLNGYPTQRVIGVSTVQCYDVKTTDGTTTFPSGSNTSTSTKFTFDDPLFLEPSTEYAIVIKSDSPSYDVWVAELGAEIIGDADGRRVSEQPYVGSFFRSQNASTWTPYINEDLMFKINRAVFDTDPISLTFGTMPTPIDVPFDELVLNSMEFTSPVANIDHSIKTTLLSTGSLEASFSDIVPNRAFWFAEKPDSLATTGRRRVITSGTDSSLQVQVSIDTNDDSISPIFDSRTYSLLVSQNLINNGELYDGSITVTDGGFHDNASNVIVTFSDSNLYPGVSGAKATANVTLNASGNVTSVNIINAGKGYIESPTITIGEPGRSANATAVVVSEDTKFGGNALARYITRKITLADGFDSGDLRVTLRAIRPQGTNIIVYYKVQSNFDTRSFSDIKWRKMYLENDLISPDLNTAIDFKYNPSEDSRINKLSYTEDGVTYPVGGTFKYFALKIVMLAECGCVSPTVRNLRAIALPEG
jgi:hypothetical protein